MLLFKEIRVISHSVPKLQIIQPFKPNNNKKQSKEFQTRLKDFAINPTRSIMSDLENLDRIKQLIDERYKDLEQLINEMD